MTMLSVRREVGEFRKRYKWMALFVSLVFSALIGRMFMLQVAEHERWAAEARNNIEKRIRLPATRGLIHDVNGKVVAGNRASYNVLLTPQYVSAKEEAQIASLMGLTDAERRDLHQKLAAVPPRRRTHLIQMFTDPDVLQPTRITRGFSHQLLKAARRIPGTAESINPHPGPQYVWEATVDLETPSGYDFSENTDRVQERVAQFATLIAVDSYARVESDT